MYVDGDRLVLSPSDLVGFLQCGHLTELSLEVVRGTRSKPAEGDQEESVEQRRGIEHERAYLARLRAEGLDVVEISEDGGLGAQAERTRVPLAAGPDVVYQATFVDGDGPGPMWRGHAAVLTKISEPRLASGLAPHPQDRKVGTP